MLFVTFMRVHILSSDYKVATFRKICVNSVNDSGFLLFQHLVVRSFVCLSFLCFATWFLVRESVGFRMQQFLIILLSVSFCFKKK